MSGTRAERPILGKLLENLRTGDVLVVWKLDRLGRSLKHLIEVVNELMTRKIGLKSLNGGEDTKRNFMHAKRQSSLETTHVIEATIGHLTVKVFSALSRRRSGI
jgi:DNA invertase Pin-like site-specific DNA recombinase